MNVLAVALLLAGILLLRTSRLVSAIGILMAQSVVVTLYCVVLGLNTGQLHIYVASFALLVVKVGIIPYSLYRIVRRLPSESEDNPLLAPNYSFIVAAVIIALSYNLIERTLPSIVSHDSIAAAVSLMLIGLLLIITRRQAVMQIN